jgi:pimeloyl-ACP methyl ester carboxylesterase
MKDLTKQAVNIQDISAKVTMLFQRRMQLAQERFNERVQAAYKEQIADLIGKPTSPWEIWTNWVQYSMDFVQRSVLFLDTLRQRGNNFVEHERAGKPPVLHFDYEMVVDARTFERPVNYALVRIIPPAGVTVDLKRRPYVIIDPRAGHGPGIGGFKDDSQVGVALREGHPVYFVIFFPQPEPGQTLLDVCDAEAHFVHKVRQLHPDSPKPVIVGNCQGGWAAMMLAASDPDDTGPIVINGAPMSYWGGAWREGEGDNPMRYAGGMLGGTWMASLAADLGDGLFDGAYLVENMEYLNPANTFWDKYYHVFANVDTEPPRFLEFERWWGGFFLLNRAEIEWIVQDLFVGNKLWTGEVRDIGGRVFDLREIKSPIILFASMGDNITPPQQAFNWVADIYGSTEEIKARGQTIVGLLHQEIGHLGIFVSGKVAKKEHKEIVSVMESIEALPAGVYGMEIIEAKGDDGKVYYDVEFTELKLEEVTNRLNRLKRVDEKPFEAVEEISEFNQRAYELFAQPLVQAFSSKATADIGRTFHPSRFQRWAFSDWNPWLWWLKPAAELVKQQRKPTSPDQPFRRAEQMVSNLVSASFDLYRDIRDAVSEAMFFQIYGNLFVTYLEDRPEVKARELPKVQDPRELPFVREALASIAEGGYPEAVARVDALLARRGQPIPLSLVELKEELIGEYRDLLPDMPRDQMRRIRGEQEIITRYEKEKAIETLPQLLREPEDRKRLLTLVDHLLTDKRIQSEGVTPEQRTMLKRIGVVLSVKPREMPLLSGRSKEARS